MSHLHNHSTAGTRVSRAAVGNLQGLRTCPARFLLPGTAATLPSVDNHHPRPKVTETRGTTICHIGNLHLKTTAWTASSSETESKTGGTRSPILPRPQGMPPEPARALLRGSTGAESQQNPQQLGLSAQISGASTDSLSWWCRHDGL